MKKASLRHSEVKRIILPVLMSLLLLTSPPLPGNSMPAGKKQSFSGTCILNEEKSEFGAYGHYWASDKLIIKSTSTTPYGEFMVTFIYDRE